MKLVIPLLGQPGQLIPGNQTVSSLPGTFREPSGE